MAASRAKLEEAARLLRAGDADGAEACLRAVLGADEADEDAADADALHLLGLVAYRRGRHGQACAAIEAAVARRPEVALYRANLGRVLAAAGRVEEAASALRGAVAAAPEDADLHYDLGLALARAGRTAEAAAAYREAVARAPAHAEAHNNLGVALAALCETEAAEECYRAALRHAPGLAAAEANLGALLCRVGRWDEAEEALRRALRAAPDVPAALNSLGTALAARRASAEAEECYRRALALDPAYAEAHNNLGTLLEAEGRFAEAEQALGAALRLRPDYAEAASNLGNVLVALGRLDEAEHAYRAALRLRPGEASSEYNLGVALLSAGRLREGWAGYERRWDRRGAARRELPAPLWKGEEIGGRILLVHAEQGLGDTIQFCRFLPLLRARHLIFEVPRPLARLLAGQRVGARIVASGEPLPPFDLHCPLMSLPHRLGTTLETIPAGPYLAADPGLVAAWAARLAALPGLKVGLVWAGNRDFAADARRSIDPALLAPLLGVPGATFVSLQLGARAPAPALADWTGEIEDFADTAGLVAALDLVIGVDTASVHLAGALGKPVWLLNRFDSCWRWLRDRPDSPWYPTLRQFRQASPGDWEGVIGAARAALIQAPQTGPAGITLPPHRVMRARVPSGRAG
jgi:Flp pilus assembly protein TadD